MSDPTNRCETRAMLEWLAAHPSGWGDEDGPNDRGNSVHRGFRPGDRYLYDLRKCSARRGWRQYDTKHDAPYFGVWVHLEEGLIFTFVEDDLSLVVCPTREGLKAELDHMAEFYGPPPPAMVAYGWEDDGAAMTRTEFYDERPSL